MKLYRFSPIKSREELFKAVQHIHFECYRLCKQSFGKYLPNAGNIGVFCHYDEEYEYLIGLRKEMTVQSDNVNQKYFRLHEPIVIPSKGDVPETTYTYLYIRRPDPTPYGRYKGDVDFILSDTDYLGLKKRVIKGEVKGAEIYDRPGWDTVQIANVNSDAVAYISTKEFSEKVRVKFD